ncbi:hypothetical protein PAMC26577_38710 [Caballeronia sordidicola]|uniref:Uncharacterized protein n=1 Tax=Caballeronia sordidicola TaxID=196367 RepID=A0A242M3G1_CABSO|nr:hypothetical protein PAMC26577_38710 [Caballeronia sordidicola]
MGAGRRYNSNVNRSSSSVFAKRATAPTSHSDTFISRVHSRT